MVAFDSKDVLSRDHASLVSAVVQLAERQGDLVADWLHSIGYLPPKVIHAPEAFLVELAAVLQVREWERHGVIEHLDIKVPTFQEAAAELVARASLGVKEFQGSKATRFSNLINTIWIENFAWDGPCLFQAELIVVTSDEEVLAEQLAEFLWQHRQDFDNLKG